MPDPRATILVIEDEPALQRFLRVTLESQDFKIIEAATGEAGLRQAASSRPDFVVLDLGLPDIDGVEVTRRLREWTAMPIIIVSRGGRSRIRSSPSTPALTIISPSRSALPSCSRSVRVVLRHLASTNQQTGDAVFESGSLRVDLSRREVTSAGKPVHLTPNEYKLLTLLIKHAGKVLTHRQLLRDVWGPDSGEEMHYLRVYMNQLRQKIEADPARPMLLLTEPGVGYRLADDR